MYDCYKKLQHLSTHSALFASR